MFNNTLKNLSILKKFLFINLIFFTIIGLFTFIYIKNVQPNLIKKKCPDTVSLESEVVSEMARSFYKEEKKVSNKKLKNDLGYQLVFPSFKEGLLAIYKSLKNSNRRSDLD